jgi:hypothetical protein
MRLIDGMTDVLVALAGLQALSAIAGGLFGSPAAVALTCIVIAGAVICLALRGSDDALAYGLSVAILVGLSVYMFASYYDVLRTGQMPTFVGALGIALYCVGIASSLERLRGLLRGDHDQSQG